MFLLSSFLIISLGITANKVLCFCPLNHKNGLFYIFGFFPFFFFYLFKVMKEVSSNPMKSFLFNMAMRAKRAELERFVNDSLTV